MKRVVLGIAAVGLIAGAALVASGRLPGAATSSAEEKTPTAAAVKTDGKVVAEAKVVPVRSAGLSLAAGGVVAEVLVAEGDRVTTGQPLLRLESARQKVAVTQAEAGLRRAEAAFDLAKVGPRTQEVQAAQAAVDAARAQLARHKQGARPEEIVAAEAGVAAARASLARAREGPTPDVIAAARNDLAKLKAGATAEDVKSAELAVEQAKTALWGAQVERDGVCGSAYAAKYQCDAGNARVGAAETAVNAAQNSLTKVKLGPRAEDIATAQARLDQLLREPSASSVAAARAQVEEAQARLDTLKAGARRADVAAAEADIRRSQAQLDLLVAGARPEAVAAAEADVAAAKAALAQAKAAVDENELRAPFAGTVAGLDAKVGESVTPVAPVAQLADVSAWQIETTDLTELNAVKIREGARVVITFDAVPGLELPGTVLRIKAIGEKRQGDMTYTVFVKPEQQDERLRWNMTATVSIEAR